MNYDKIIFMERGEYLVELLHLFDLGKGATAPEILDKYLEKTLEIKFQRILIGQEALKEEFVRYHEAFVKILKILQGMNKKLTMSLFSNDQLAKFFFNQGVYAVCKDDFLQAGEKFQDAYKINKQNVFLLTYLGILLTTRKNYYAAEKYFTDAFRRGADNDDAWFYAAENFFKARSFKKALEYYERARKLNPARNEIALRIKECREAMVKKEKTAGKDSLLRRVVMYIRNAFER